MSINGASMSWYLLSFGHRVEAMCYGAVFKPRNRKRSIARGHALGVCLHDYVPVLALSAGDDGLGYRLHVRLSGRARYFDEQRQAACDRVRLLGDDRERLRGRARRRRRRSASEERQQENRYDRGLEHSPLSGIQSEEPLCYPVQRESTPGSAVLGAQASCLPLLAQTSGRQGCLRSRAVKPFDVSRHSLGVTVVKMFPEGFHHNEQKTIS